SSACGMPEDRSKRRARPSRSRLWREGDEIRDETARAETAVSPHGAPRGDLPHPIPCGPMSPDDARASVRATLARLAVAETDLGTPSQTIARPGAGSTTPA